MLDKGEFFLSEEYFKPKVLLFLIYLKKCINPSKCTLPGFDETFANFCTAKLKYTLVDKDKSMILNKLCGECLSP